MAERAAASFANRLLAWWDEHGRKDLPWQRPRTPYRVWISEIMLQQTQVQTVIPYFERWVGRFPDIETLARAPLDEVLSHWAGLGYYARARNLHQAARECLERHDGELPSDAEALSQLPGIGQSTANAIVSQASDRPAAVLDGNVRRLLARHAAVEGWFGTAAVRRRLWAEAQSRLPPDRGADYTQAVMDLGALVCTRSRPSCEQCPVATDCLARRRGLQQSLPTPKPRNRVADRDLHMLIVRDVEGRLLLEKRPPAGIWGGLWCLPDGDDLDAIEERLGLAVEPQRTLPSIHHRLSHVRMTIRPVVADLAAGTQVQCSGSCGWFGPAQRARLGLPRPVAELLQEMDEGELS
jgi:A/G-specific adenine glycosylase